MNVLYVSATKQEAARLPHNVPLLVTGIGTVNAAIAMCTWLATTPQRPRRVINFGTAGALVDSFEGIFEISHTFQHDFDHEKLSRVTGFEIKNGIDLQCSGQLPTAILATGNSFISDDVSRARLSAMAQLCDMEGYAIAAACQAFGVPCTLIKQVSDSADGQAAVAWSAAVKKGAEQLADTVMQLSELVV